MVDNLTYVESRDHDMSMIRLRHVPAMGFIMTMANFPENRFCPELVAQIHRVLDYVLEYRRENIGKPCALMTTSACPGFYSNGLDVSYLLRTSDEWFISDKFLPLLRRMITFPVPTVACIAGHAYAGGLMFALCHDFRIMSSAGDRIKLCLNEIQLPSSLHFGMARLVRAKVGSSLLTSLTIGARRFNALSSLNCGLVNQICSPLHIFEIALEYAIKVGRKSRRTHIYVIEDTKNKLYYDVYEAMSIREPINVRNYIHSNDELGCSF